VRRASSIGCALQALFLFCAGCLPFLASKREPPRTPAAVQRFKSAAVALGVPPSPPSLRDATLLLGGAVAALPNAPAARDRGHDIDVAAQSMQGEPSDADAGRRSIDLALQGLDSMKKPAGSKNDRARAVATVRKAVGVHDGYRALADALVLFTGGPSEVASGAALSALVARFAVEDDDSARRTGAQAVHAIAVELRARGVDPGDLENRADRVAKAAPLEYATALREALSAAADALGKLPGRTPAFDALRGEAHDAVQRLAKERPFELQRAAMQDALRLIADALTVASRTAAAGP
jgi:hypothetical protein